MYIMYIMYLCIYNVNYIIIIISSSSSIIIKQFIDYKYHNKKNRKRCFEIKYIYIYNVKNNMKNGINIFI